MAKRARPYKQFPRRSKVRSRHEKELRRLSNKWRCRVREIRRATYRTQITVPIRQQERPVFVGISIMRAPEKPTN